MKKLAKTAYAGYIYEDGHAVIVHEENHTKAGSVQWVEIIEKINAVCSFKGRIVFHHPSYDARLRLALFEARVIRATTPTTENGSENTKRLNLAVGHFGLEFKDGGDLSWTTMPDIISNGMTYQPDFHEAYNPEWNDGCAFWGEKRIAKVHRAPAVETEQAQAA